MCELLELLQHCDVRTAASLVSSTLSSRAPSPSPSLRSIIYPGIKPPLGSTGIPASPLSTPVLNSCSNNTCSGKNTSGSTISSCSKQTIPTSVSCHTDISDPIDANSISETVTSADARSEVTTPLVAVNLEEKHKIAAAIRQKGTEMADSVKPKLATYKPRELRAADRRNKAAKQEGTVHLRSLSNEVDYVSFTGSGHSDSFTLRSPPLSAHTSRPLRFTFHEHMSSCSGDGNGASKEGDLQTRTDKSPPPAQEGKDVKLKKNDDISVKETDGPELAEAVSSKSIEPEPKSGEGSSWMKEFNESLWSNYFVSSDQTF